MDVNTATCNGRVSAAEPEKYIIKGLARGTDFHLVSNKNVYLLVDPERSQIQFLCRLVVIWSTTV